MGRFRDRIKEFRRVKGREMLDNAGNFRTHPRMQRDALRGLLEAVGIVGALVAYESARYGGLTLLDGHLRKDTDPETEWPTLILDVNDEEADLVLATFDPIGALAEVDVGKVDELLARVTTDDLALKDVLVRLQDEADGLKTQQQKQRQKWADEDGPPEMALQPFEHYDYLVLFFKSSLDFERALDTLAVGKVRYTAHSRKRANSAVKVGLGRVLDGAQVMERVWGDDSNARSE